MRNRSRTITASVKRLGKGYSSTISFINAVDHGIDMKTGINSRTYNRLDNIKAIVHPKVIDRSFIYDLSYLAANRNFTEGGTFERGLISIVVEKAKLGTFILDKSTIVRVGGNSWIIKKINTDMFADAFVVITIQKTANSILGTKIYNPLSISCVAKTIDPIVVIS